MPSDDAHPNSIDAALESLKVTVKDLDPLLIATALAVVSLLPGLAGEAGAAAAVAYDIRQKRWYGIVLSAASMIPLIGYIPALIKLGLLLFLINRHLNILEAILQETRESPEASSIVEGALSKYYRKLPELWLTQPLRQRIERIVGPDKLDPVGPSEPSCDSPEDISNSAQIPK